jgi:hypothetical protein
MEEEQTKVTGQVIIPVSRWRDSTEGKISIFKREKRWLNLVNRKTWCISGY